MSPDGGGKPSGALAEQIEKDFRPSEAFKAQFLAASNAVQGSGWGVLIWQPLGQQLVILQAEKHQNLAQWGATPESQGQFISTDNSLFTEPDGAHHIHMPRGRMHIRGEDTIAFRQILGENITMSVLTRNGLLQFPYLLKSDSGLNVGHSVVVSNQNVVSRSFSAKTSSEVVTIPPSPQVILFLGVKLNIAASPKVPAILLCH